MILEDFVMLGKTVPETNSDGRQFVCTAGYSLELKQPIRIYPMARRNCPTRWSISRIPLERNSSDSRNESWKIKGDRRPGPHEHINNVISVLPGKASPETQREIIAAMTVSSLKEANNRRLSLCVIQPQEIPTMRFDEVTAVEMTALPDLFGMRPDLPVKQRFRWQPRLKFRDVDGAHDLMLRDWGCYELMRKRGAGYCIVSLSEALNLLTSPPLLCGNFNQHRTTWLVIGVFSGTVHARPEVADRQFALDL